MVLGKGKVALRGKTTVGGYLPGHAAILLLLPLKHRRVLFAVGRIAPENQAVKDHGGHTTREKDLVAELGLTPLLDDDVGMVLEEGDYFLRDGNLLLLEDPPVGLVDDLVEDAYCPRKLFGQDLAGKEVGKILSLMGGQFRDCRHGILPDLAGI